MWAYSFIANKIEALTYLALLNTMANFSKNTKLLLLKIIILFSKAKCNHSLETVFYLGTQKKLSEGAVD